MPRIPTHRPPTHPGEMLRAEFLEPLGLTQTEAAERAFDGLIATASCTPRTAVIRRLRSRAAIRRRK